MNSEEKQYVRKKRQKTEIENLIPLHPIVEQIFSLYTRDRSKADCKIFSEMVGESKLSIYFKVVGLVASALR
ncbi:hypothetical protein [Porphyromonas macacae]|uniref:hypothetical protein n=1 Tax=Porphyromonas macacae TaxID=28115 RepID=UPI00359F3A58